MFNSTHHNAERLLDSHPALGLVVAVGVLADGQPLPWVGYEHTVGGRVCCIPQDEVAWRQVSQKLIKPRELERRTVILAPGAVHRPRDEPVLCITYTLAIRTGGRDMAEIRTFPCRFWEESSVMAAWSILCSTAVPVLICAGHHQPDNEARRSQTRRQCYLSDSNQADIDVLTQFQHSIAEQNLGRGTAV